MGILKRSSKLLPRQSLVTISNTLLLPYFDYCAIVWGTTTATNINRLQRLQNRAMRIILQCHPRTHVSDMLKELKWLSVKQRIMLLQCTWMWKAMNGLVPENLASEFCKTHNRKTRSSTNNKLQVEICNHRSFRYAGTRAWNSIPLSIKNCSSIATFKNQLSHYIASTGTTF